jgi:predicted amidophosphoribosyltransferase
VSNLVCWNCGASLDDIPRPISRHAACPECFNELHCCRLCRHYDAAANMTCHEERAEPPLQKENANFCDFFSPHSGAFDGAKADKSVQARNDLDALFGPEAVSPETGDTEQDEDQRDDMPLSDAELARKKLDDLFK